MGKCETHKRRTKPKRILYIALPPPGSKWHSRRKLLTPAFHFKILEDFLDVFNGQSTTMVQQLRGKADGKPFDIFPFITRCALDIICGERYC